MPLKSKAQWRKWGALLSEGKIPKSKFDEATHASRPYQSLPDRLAAKPVPRKGK